MAKRNWQRMAFAALGVLALSGCSTIENTVNKAGNLFGKRPAMVRAAEADACGAQKLSYHLGHGLAPDVERDIAARSGHEVRYIEGRHTGLGNPTAQRLDVYYYGDNRIINAMVCS